jgi:hypothetical protein
MSPTTFLIGAIAITLIAVIASSVARAFERKLLKQLAASWRMHYSPTDRFRLATRIAERFPIPGAANIRVTDVIYAAEGDAYRYLVTAEYTIGVIQAKKRRRLVCTMREPKGSQGKAFDVLKVADTQCALAAQYLDLFESCVRPPGEEKKITTTEA